MKETTEDIKALREIAERDQKAKALAGTVTLLLIVLIAGWCTWASKELEADKKWCINASPKEFVDNFESKCSRYSNDPAIRARIDRIRAGLEK